MSSIFVVKFPGQLIPEAALKPLLSMKSNCAGFVVPAMIDNNPKLMVDKADLREVEFDLKMFQERQKTFEKHSMAFWLGELSDGFEADDVQPFGIEDKIAIFADGTFGSFSKTDSAKPNSFHFVHQYVIPKLTKIFNDCGQDTKKFIQTLQDDAVLEMEIGAISQGGIVTVVTDTNMYKTWPKGVNSQTQHFDWGWASNKSVSFAVDNKDKPVLQAPAAKTGFGSFFNKKATAEPAKPAPGTEPQPEVPEAPKTDTAVPQAIPEGKAWMSPPSFLTSNSNVREWYQRKGSLPENWKNRVAILVDLKGLSDKEKSELKKQNDKSAGPERTEVLGKDKASGKNISVTSEHIPSPETDTSYVKQKDINALHADFVQTDRFVSDPTKAAEQEKSRQTFADFKLGSLEDFMRGADRAKLEHAAMYVEFAVTIMMDLRKQLGWVGPKADTQKPAEITEDDKQKVQQDGQPEPKPQVQKTGFGSFFKPKAA